MSNSTFDGETVLVVGSGLLGTSVALGLTAQGARVHLRDLDPENVTQAVGIGAGSSEPAVAPMLVVLAVPPSAVIEQARGVLAEFETAIVTDVTSVKSPLAREIDNQRFVGGHPMAGKERSGPLAASAKLFEGRPWAIVPHEGSGAEAVALVEELAVALGAVRVHMTPELHDEAVALVSHVPHLVSNLTAGLLTGATDAHMVLAGQGLRDVTRIARSDTGLWVDIIGANAAPISDRLHELRDNLDELISIVDSDAANVERFLARGRAGTANIPGKHGERPTDVVTVYVAIDDEPGELARLLFDIGNVNVNIEDLRIEHEVGRPVGLIEVLVLPERADYLVDALNSRGWTAYL